VRHLLRTIGGDLIEPIDQFGIASAFLDYMRYPIATSAAAFGARQPNNIAWVFLQL
jgi:hypothetical protein